MNFSEEIGYSRNEAPPDENPCFYCDYCGEPIEGETFVELEKGNYHISCINEWIDNRVVVRTNES